MDTLFWVGIAVFALGFVLRYIFKFRYYSDYRAKAHTDRHKQEMAAKYRPLVFIGLGVEMAGCIISFISLLLA